MIHITHRPIDSPHETIDAIRSKLVSLRRGNAAPNTTENAFYDSLVPNLPGFVAAMDHVLSEGEELPVAPEAVPTMTQTDDEYVIIPPNSALEAWKEVQSIVKAKEEG